MKQAGVGADLVVELAELRRVSRLEIALAEELEEATRSREAPRLAKLGRAQVAPRYRLLQDVQLCALWE